MQQQWYERERNIILLIILAFPVGLFFMWKYAPWSMRVKMLISLTVAVLCIWFLTSVGGAKPTTVQPTSAPQPKKSASHASTSPDDNKQPTTPKPPAYEVVAYAHEERSDTNETYYVAMNPVNTDTPAFKNDVKKVVQDIATNKKKSPNFSAYIYDDPAVALATSNNVIVDDSERAQHNIANYIGGIDPISANASGADDAYRISYYPSAFVDTPTVGRFIAIEQWKPTGF
ncbi:MAG TPA: hypothetical protein VLH38_02965 [Patescibacteria group bacterium]|nr:hypothetical protein [Patescibacteria group bacterium]